MRDVRESAAAQDITFPLVKQELEDSACVPHALTFPTIKDEVIEDDDAEYVWWDLKPDKEQLDFAIVKDEFIDYDYQAQEHTIPDQDQPVSNGSGEEDQRWCDDLPASHGRHTNRFVIDSDPEELDESLYSHIKFNPNSAEAEASIWNCRTVYEECDNGTRQEEVTIDEVITYSDEQIKSESNSEYRSFMEMDTNTIEGNGTEDVIVIDDDDEDDHMVKGYGNDTTSINDGEHNNEIIVIDDDDDDNFVNNKCQQENYEMKNEHNSAESRVEEQKTTAKKRKRKQDKKKIKCIVLFDGQETRRIPIIRKNKSKISAKSCQIKVPHTKSTETAEDEIQETNLSNSMHIGDGVQREVPKDGGDMLSPKTNSETASFERAEHANKLETAAGGCGEYLVNTAQRCVYSTESTHKIKSHMQLQQLCSKLVQGVKEFGKSEQDMKQYTCAPKIRKHKSIQNRKQYKSTLEMKQSGASAQERMHPSMSAQARMQHGMTAQERMQPSKSASAQERMQPGTSTQESMQPGTSAQESMQPGTSAQESMQPGTSEQESMQPSTSAQERMQPGMSAQERMQLGASAQERMQYAAYIQKRMQHVASAQKIQHDTSAQGRMQHNVSAQERMHPSQSAMGIQQCSTSLQDLKQHSKPVEKIKQCSKLSEVVRQCINSIHIKKNGIKSSLTNSQNHDEGNESCNPQISENLSSQELLQNLNQKITELELRSHTHKQSVKLTEGIQTGKTSQENTESLEGLLHCKQSIIEVVKKCIASLQGSSKCTELENGVQQCQTSVYLQKVEAASKDLLQPFVWLLEELVRSHHCKKEVQSKDISSTESQQIQSAASDAQPHDQSGIDFVGCEKLINLQHLNQNMNSQLVDLTNSSSEKNESAKNSHQSNVSKSDKQQIDHAANNLENCENSLHSSRPSETVMNETLYKIPVACKLCSKHFKSHRGLKLHIGRMHREVTHRYCSECQQDFVTFDLLRNHYESQHFNQANKSVTIQKLLENQVYSHSSEQKLVLSKGRKECRKLSTANIQYSRRKSSEDSNNNLLNDHVQYHKKPSIVLSKVQKNRQQQLGDTADRHHMDSSNSHIISRPPSLQSNTTAPHSQPAPLQSSVSSADSRTILMQSSPSTSPSKPVPLPPCPASLKLRYTVLQTSPSHEHLAHKNIPFDSISTPQTNHALLPDKAIYKQKKVETRIHSVQRPMEAAILKAQLQTRLNDHLPFLTSQTNSELHANHKRYLNGGASNDTQSHKGDSLHTVLETGADIVWQKEKNVSDHNSDFGSESSLTRANVTRPFIHNTNQLNTGATHTMNYNHPQSMHHPGMRRRANESCQIYNGFNTQYNISRMRALDILNFRKQQGYFMKKTSNLQPIYDAYNCKQAPCRDPQCTSSFCKTVFATNFTQVPAGLLGHDSVHGVDDQNLSNPISNNIDVHAKHMSQPAIELVKQPVIVANYNTVTYIQNNIPCVV